jgi:hypothetical protein
MRIVQFENRGKAPLTLKVEPFHDVYQVPPLGEAGIRFTLSEGVEDRSHTSVSEFDIAFWCDADSYEIDVVPPTPAETLYWTICVVGGWCGGIVENEPTHVEDLLPDAGEVTSRRFAELAVHADGWPADAAMPEKHLLWLEAKFVEIMGAQVVEAAALQRRSRRPFDPEGA